jgi:HSP20 family protein
MSTKALMKANDLFPSVFDDFFKPWNEWFGNGNGWKPITVPSVNITENKNDYHVALAAPGLKKADFTIDVEGNMLTVSSRTEESKEEKDSRYTRKEYSYSSFSRSFTLPDDVVKDKIEASYEDGLLNIILPKDEGARKASLSKHIAIK